ncbi:methyltransferase [Blautia sp. MSJ-19]|uniref:methyltransferase n=1 Tax=Blautia sp. MSJ-19 TaxID=2841517 RepID=UPI001C0EB290|nr:methyltransferase [Blautia sp. MSJ-19]MBU5481066.1 methyltransferase [Blautia sp. MSJ-19]
MTEKIGQVILDDTYYPGQDLYTDGAIEDEMLEIARTYPEEQWNQVIAERKSWPILYHYSHIRENILSWLPFTGRESVLEIGSGCGAVTGALCKKAAKVTCIELSKKRSMINAWRHKDFANLQILMGNFQDIEKTLTEKYDYITLIGVFEYGEAYIQSETPYIDFLKIISRHLKPDGKIVLAIENRLGLKYWAGCTEDHFGTLFEGLEGYPTTSGVKTFSKKELSAILEKAGNLQASWYYPFPDYKLPMTIYSDRRLPAKGELNRLETNYDRLRLQLFQESPVYDSLLENDLYPEFANSFLLLISKEKIETETIYSKFSNERAPEFDIRTDICENHAGKRSVRKLPADTRAVEHVKNLERISRELSAFYGREGLEMNTCSAEEEGVRLEYLEGETLEERLDSLLEKGKLEELEKLFFMYLKKIRHIHEGEIFFKTPEFVEVFGDAEISENCRCSGMSNIDLVPANILIEKDRVSVIDYEWTFRFPIPCKYILYRMIHYYLESDGKRRILKERDFYGKAGISQKEIELFAEMERHFQNYMQGTHIPLLSMYEEVSPGKVDILAYYEQLRAASAERRLQVFYDRGADFSEKDSVLLPMGRQGVCIDIPIPEGVHRLRLDPGEAVGGLELKTLTLDDGKKLSFSTNGFPLGAGQYYFGAGDPQFIVEDLPKKGQAVRLEVYVMKAQDAQEKFWKAFASASAQKDQEIRKLKRQIHEMENTKVWKLYRGIKKK